jgi:thiol:disulfide interchange protein DsbD
MIRFARYQPLLRVNRTIAVAGALAANLWLIPAAAAQQPGFPSMNPGGLEQEPAFGDSRDRVEVSAFPEQNKVAPGSDVVIAIVLDHQPGWHSWPNMGNTGKGMAEFSGAINTEVKVEKPDGSPLQVHDGFVQWPAVHGAKADLGEGEQEYAVFSERAMVYLPVTVKADAAPRQATLTVHVSFQTCDDRQCLAPADVSLPITIEIVDLATLAGSPATKADPATLAGFDPSVWVKIHTGVAAPKIVPFDLFGWEFEIDAAGPVGLLLLCLIAALGGVLLNLTPCVLPVIPIKIMSLAQHAGHRGRTLLLGFSMFLGVIAFWVALGGALSGAVASIKGFTATNQLFQYPWFTITVGVIIAIMAIGMAGFFTVRLPQAVYMVNPRQDTLHGSFLFGIMTAVLSTPCTAPFMGAAAAWALKQPTSIVLTVFLAIGVGMGAPYFILSAFPRLVDKMPRTGPASEVIKQVMGLLMLAAAAYFIGVGLSGALVNPPDPPSRLYLWVVAAFVAAAGAWLVWRTFGITRSTARRSIFGGLGAALVAAAAIGGAWLTDPGPIKWIYYTPERFAAAKSTGKVVVMEFTAEWCLNCKALEQGVLQTDLVADLLNSEGVAPIKIDLTGNNIAGNDMLTAVERRSIPLLVIFAPDGREVFKGDFYTIDQVLQAVESAKSSGRVAANTP